MFLVTNEKYGTLSIYTTIGMDQRCGQELDQDVEPEYGEQN